MGDTTSLRPLWFGSTATQGPTWCWIATGDPTVLAHGFGSVNGSHGGWMYDSGGTPTNCAAPPDDRRYSTVNVPNVGLQTWSFDLITWIRSGTFSYYECNW